MKKIIIIIAIAVITFLSQTQFGSICYAKTITLSNSTGDIAMYNNLQTAINSADAGDLIYIFPSPTNYGSITINKKLTLIGAGYYSKISSITNINFDANSSNSQLYGLNITGNCTLSSGTDSNYVINRCLIYGTLTLKGENVIINNCLFQTYQHGTGIIINNAENIIISNNIFNTQLSSAGYQISTSNKYSVLIENNIFLASSASQIMFSSVANAEINNNIFYKVKPLGLSNCSVNNNIVFNGTDALPYGDNSGENNINAKDPEFVDMQGLTYFTFTGDYHLKDSSPGKNAGLDSTDIGIYGSAEFWPEDTGYTGKPPLPIINKMNVLNKVVGEDSKVRVKVQAIKAK
ncbi:MAG: right-handed parallel beta-helix repeat-containing protein [bacterium]